MQTLAEVHIWGELAGALAYDPVTQISTFEYSPQWLAGGVEIAPLHMPLSTQLYQFPGLNPETYKGLPAILADTLPDDFGNAVINAWLVRQGRDIHSFNALERLLYTGSRGMGALEFAPVISDKSVTADQLELESLVEMAQKILDQRNSNAFQMAGDEYNNDAMSAMFQVGTSAGGARAKALVAVNKNRSRLCSGQVDAPPGYEHYLLKFDGVEEHKTSSQVFGDPKGFGRMEYAYYLMAKDVGINMSPSELLLDGERAHFMTRRFDRIENEKLHYVSLCAMDHADYAKAGAYSYEQLLSVARQLKLPRADAVEIFRRMVFNVISRNHDDHTKNTGFLLDQNTLQWRLSPAFDLAYSFKPHSPWVSSHQMTINGKRDGFSRDDLLLVSEHIGNFKKEAKKIIDEVSLVVSNWNSYADRAGVFQTFISEIKKNHRVIA